MVNINFNQIVIYGPYTQEHPNGWIFLGFQKAFIYKRYKVIWINQERKEMLNKYNLSNSLFITDSIHDDDIPLRNDSFYILYENYKSKYDNYNKLHIGKYTNNLPNYVSQWQDKSYIQYSLENKELFFPLAVELVPDEILNHQKNTVLNYPGDEKVVCTFGSITANSNLYSDLKSQCIKNYYKFCIMNNHSIEQRLKCIKTCQIVPLISSHEQISNDVIDHRVFQTIAYGGFPSTNSQITANLIDSMCIYYGTNAKELIIDGINFKKNNFDDLCKWQVMNYIKNEHTYLHRINVIFWMLMRM